MDQFVLNIIRKRKEESPQELRQKTDLLSRYLCMKNELNQEFSDSYLRGIFPLGLSLHQVLTDYVHYTDILMNFFIAGRDTTAILLSWTFYLLSQHPHVERNVCKDISMRACTQQREKYSGGSRNWPAYRQASAHCRRSWPTPLLESCPG